MLSLAPVDASMLQGTTLRGTAAKYYVHTAIGEGGQGWVFRASYDDAEGFPVVVKVLRPDSATRDALDRFRREAEILKQISSTNPSPFIVRFYDHGEAEFPLALSTREFARLPFTVMEYVHGEPLHAVINNLRGHGLPLKQVRRILKEVRIALEIVHAQGLIHRDLKPSNILIAHEAGREVAKVTDFGLVKIVDIRATSTQSLAGVSLSYAPPEQYEPGNPRVGPPTDVFSYGTIVYELLCGSAAYPAASANPFEALRRIAIGSRIKLNDRISIVSPELRDRADLVKRIDALLDVVLSPEPGNRPQTISAAWEQFDSILREPEGAKMEISGAFPPVGITHRGAPEAPRVGFPSRSMGSDPMLMPTAVPDLIVPTRPGAVTRDPQDLRAWAFRVLTAGNPGAHVRDATFSDDLREALTLGNAGLVHWTPNGYRAVPLAIGLAPHELRGMARMPNGSHVFCGDGGLVAFFAGGMWDVRRYPDPDVSFHAVAANPDGQVAFAVGVRASRGTAVMVEAVSTGFRRTFEVPEPCALRAIAYADGRTSFACGDGGLLVRVDDNGLLPIRWERSGHLRAIVASSPSQVFAVGTGGHAISIAARTEIEKVNTTQDLLGVAIAPDGAAWACSANARLLRRDAAGAWRRIPVDLPVQSNLVRVAPRGERILIVSEDAAVIEGVRT
jgi:eukaryotic-like serine/threonine-protein kinase